MLADKHVLLVEDQFLISMDIANALHEAGAQVTERAHLREALEAARHQEVTAAVLDVDLGGDYVYPAADILHSKGIPILFHTGHARQDWLEMRYPGCKVCLKPMLTEDLVRILARMLEPKRQN